MLVTETSIDDDYLSLGALLSSCRRCRVGHCLCGCPVSPHHSTLSIMLYQPIASNPCADAVFSRTAAGRIGQWRAAHLPKD